MKLLYSLTEATRAFIPVWSIGTLVSELRAKIHIWPPAGIRLACPSGTTGWTESPGTGWRWSVGRPAADA